MAAAVASKLQFPSEDAIIAYLAKHPSTRDFAYLKETKVYEAVAKVFAHLNVSSQAITWKTCLPLLDLNLGLSDETFTIMLSLMSIALNDCGSGQAIEEEAEEA